MRPPTNNELVERFMRAMGQQVREHPGFPDDETVALRYGLIDEELSELHQAITNNDLLEVADALTDLLYVVYGAGHAFGIDLDACFQEVHRSNMSKLGSDGNVIRNEHGKVLKPASYSPPNLNPFIAVD